MNRNILYLVIVLLAVAVSALGYYYQEQKTASGVDITVDDQGLSIQKK